MGTDTGTQVSQKAGQAKEAVAEQAGQVTERGRNLVQEQLDQRSTDFGMRVASTSHALRDVAEESRRRGDEPQARLAEQAAERTQRVSKYLIEADGERMLHEAEDFARRQPWTVVAAGLAVGFLAARAFKASSSDRYQQRYPTYTYDAGRSSRPGSLPHGHEPRVPVGNGEAETSRMDIGARP